MSRFGWKASGFIVAVLGIGLLPLNRAPAQTSGAFGAPGGLPQPQALSSAAQAVPSGTIANNDSIYIDGKNFTVTPGRAKGDAAVQIKALGARDLGPGAIVFRSREKLYIVSSPLVLPDAHNQAGNNGYVTATQVDQPGRIKIHYDPPKNPDLKEIYDRLKDHQFLEKIQQILSPLRLPEDLHIQTTECGVMNAWYRRENSGPTVTMCYELLKTVSDSAPKETTPSSAITSRSASTQISRAGWSPSPVSTPQYRHNFSGTASASLERTSE